jgi:hypothetical protein
MRQSSKKKKKKKKGKTVCLARDLEAGRRGHLSSWGAQEGEEVSSTEAWRSLTQAFLFRTYARLQQPTPGHVLSCSACDPFKSPWAA